VVLDKTKSTSRRILKMSMTRSFVDLPCVLIQYTQYWTTRGSGQNNEYVLSDTENVNDPLLRSSALRTYPVHAVLDYPWFWTKQ
jgi:hypothetical protein